MVRVKWHCENIEFNGVVTTGKLKWLSRQTVNIHQIVCEFEVHMHDMSKSEVDLADNMDTS